jgi:histidine ammonia-lyase
VRWLGEEAWRKYQKLMQGVKIEEHDIINVIQEVRKTRGGALLDPDDVVCEVLDNDDFVNIVLTTDTQINVGTIPDELRHVLEPMPSNFLPADNYVFLDGSNLSTELLVNLGNGEFKIKVMRFSFFVQPLQVGFSCRRRRSTTCSSRALWSRLF